MLTPGCHLSPRLSIRAVTHRALNLFSAQRAAAGCMEALLTLRLKFCGEKRHFRINVNAPSAPTSYCKDLTNGAVSEGFLLCAAAV